MVPSRVVVDFWRLFEVVLVVYFGGDNGGQVLACLQLQVFHFQQLSVTHWFLAEGMSSLRGWPLSEGPLWSTSADAVFQRLRALICLYHWTTVIKG